MIVLLSTKGICLNVFNNILSTVYILYSKNGKMIIIKDFEKGKFDYALCREEIWGTRCIDPHILDLGTSSLCVLNFTLWLLYPWKKSSFGPIGLETGCAPEPVSMTWRGEKSCRYWESNFVSTGVQPILRILKQDGIMECFSINLE
jgi:hypothetical protein